MKIGVDFDGVLVQHKMPQGDEADFEDKPVDDARQVIRWLIEHGHEIYVLTAKPPKYWSRIRLWLREWGFPELRVTNVKEVGTSIFIDDRAYRFTNWQDIRKLLT